MGDYTRLLIPGVHLRHDLSPRENAFLEFVSTADWLDPDIVQEFLGAHPARVKDLFCRSNERLPRFEIRQLGTAHRTLDAQCEVKGTEPVRAFLRALYPMLAGFHEVVAVITEEQAGSVQHWLQVADDVGVHVIDATTGAKVIAYSWPNPRQLSLPDAGMGARG